jgi:hypothetical protein
MLGSPMTFSALLTMRAASANRRRTSRSWGALQSDTLSRGGRRNAAAPPRMPLTSTANRA